MTSPRLAVVMVNWNGTADTLACVDSLREQLQANDSVLVVDNGSSPDQLTPLRAAAGNAFALIENGTNRGFAGATNVGVRRALELDAQWVLWWNNDALPGPGCIETLLTTAQARDLAAAQPLLVSEPQTDRIDSAGLFAKPGPRSIGLAARETDPRGSDRTHSNPRSLRCRGFVPSPSAARRRTHGRRPVRALRRPRSGASHRQGRRQSDARADGGCQPPSGYLRRPRRSGAAPETQALAPAQCGRTGIARLAGEKLAAARSARCLADGAGTLARPSQRVPLPAALATGVGSTPRIPAGDGNPRRRPQSVCATARLAPAGAGTNSLLADDKGHRLP